MAEIRESNLKGLKLKNRGKVRDIYDLGKRLLIVASDRISAFDVVLPNVIPDKGRVLTSISVFWFERFPEIRNHLIETDVNKIGEIADCDKDAMRGRVMLCEKVDIIPVECVVRGYLAGSGLKEYRKSRTVCGIPLPAGLDESSELPEVIFTPSTKATEGHDENIAFEEACRIVGADVAAELRDRSLDLYKKARDYARSRGIIIADTKFEWGRNVNGEIVLADEILTPDSSRFWPASAYRVGVGQPSFDKQIVRDWLEKQSGWDKTPPGPVLPDEIVAKARGRYIEAYELLTGRRFV